MRNWQCLKIGTEMKETVNDMNVLAQWCNVNVLAV